ncbi:hypothetical protein CPAR01_02329 [Colletotrichum paranaense]|uniref:Uncharacterized protein n=1 Tax=Colletotrichum paranaense TaxID=1914294 RepID=A0ABQ9SZ67_9PEZI|nr:uncharacterized protein CPAR01_02329 [Colletotrichum paranaense]KAK1544827.1 hypothetical protein CPAR01_02329 [Colletotrichum paranaense]
MRAVSECTANKGGPDCSGLCDHDRACKKDGLVVPDVFDHSSQVWSNEIQEVSHAKWKDDDGVCGSVRLPRFPRVPHFGRSADRANLV